MRSNRRALFGAILILVGLLLIMDNLHIIPHIPRDLFSWPVIFIFIGLFNLVSGNRSAAVIFIAIGSLFYLHHYWYFDFRTYWPAILVIIGLVILLRRRDMAQRRSSGTDDKYFDDLNIFGGSSKRFTSKNLEGGRVTNIFGGSDIDLRETSPVDGATIEIFTLFGGCNIIVPAHWDVSIQTTAIFGGFDDKRESSDAKSNYKVYIRGFTMFGGGDLKSSK